VDRQSHHQCGWDSDKVRQGADLAVNRAAPLTDGKIDVKWQVTGKADGISFGPVTISADNVDCAPKLSGGGLGCVATSGGIGLPGGISLPQGWIVAKLAINVTFDVTPEGAVVSRGFSIGGNQVAGPDDLSLTEAGQTESLKVPCTAKAGDAVDYKLDPFHWTPKTTASRQFTIRLVDSLDPDGIVELFEYKSFGIGSAQVSNASFDLTGSGFITSMGPLLANNVKPTIAPSARSRDKREARSRSRPRSTRSAPSSRTSGTSPTARSRSVPRRSAPSVTTASTTVS
jgi:hypothetical protein